MCIALLVVKFMSCYCYKCRSVSDHFVIVVSFFYFFGSYKIFILEVFLYFNVCKRIWKCAVWSLPSVQVSEDLLHSLLSFTLKFGICSNGCLPSISVMI